MSTPSDSDLIEALGVAQRLGAFGPGSLRRVVDHAEAFVAALADVTGTVVDLGSGGGMPGVVIAARRPDLELVLVDRSQGRIDALVRIVQRLGLADRVRTLCADVASLPGAGWTPVAAAVARSFAAPDRTLQLARPLVGEGGRIIVSEPPYGDRWEPELLASLGVQRIDVTTTPRARLAVFRCFT